MGTVGGLLGSRVGPHPGAAFSPWLSSGTAHRHLRRCRLTCCLSCPWFSGLSSSAAAVLASTLPWTVLLLAQGLLLLLLLLVVPRGPQPGVEVQPPLEPMPRQPASSIGGTHL